MKMGQRLNFLTRNIKYDGYRLGYKVSLCLEQNSWIKLAVSRVSSDIQTPAT